MQNEENNFEIFIGFTKSMLGQSYEELKRRYLSYHISLSVHVDKKINFFQQFIEIRFSEQQSTIFFNFNQTDE